MWQVIESILNNIISTYGLLGVILIFIFGILATYLYKHGFILARKEMNGSAIKTSSILKSISNNPDYLDGSIVSFAKAEEDRIIGKKLLGISNNKIQHEIFLILKDHPGGYDSITLFKKYDKYLTLNNNRLVMEMGKVRKDKIISWFLIIEFIVILCGSLFSIYRGEVASAISFIILAFSIYFLALVISPPTKSELRRFEEYTSGFYDR